LIDIHPVFADVSLEAGSGLPFFAIRRVRAEKHRMSNGQRNSSRQDLGHLAADHPAGAVSAPRQA
jgi:hypothetical protein